jgi:hypothetical protein
MTRKELEHVKKVLLNIKPRDNGMGIHGRVQLAINYVEKDLAQRQASRDNFKDMYESDTSYPW